MSDVLLKRRLYCEEHSSLFYTLYIHASQRAMQVTLRGQHHMRLPRDAYTWTACCVVAGDGPLWCRSEVGSLHFTKRALSLRIVAHEAAHAALGWLKRTKISIETPVDGFASPAEERFCNVFDGLVGQIYWRCQQAGLI